MKRKKDTIFIFSAYWSKEKSYYGNILELLKNEELFIKNVPVTYRLLTYHLSQSLKNGRTLKMYEVMNWKVEEVEVTRSARKKTIKN